MLTRGQARNQRVREFAACLVRGPSENLWVAFRPRMVDIEPESAARKRKSNEKRTKLGKNAERQEMLSPVAGCQLDWWENSAGNRRPPRGRFERATNRLTGFSAPDLRESQCRQSASVTSTDASRSVLRAWRDTWQLTLDISARPSVTLRSATVGNTV